MVNMSVPYRGPDGMSAQLFAEVRARFGARAQNLGYITGYPEAARAGQTGGHFPDVHGITHAVDIGVDIQADGTGLDTRDALWLAHHLRALGAAGKHPFSRRGYLIHDMSETATPRPLIAGFHTQWKWEDYKGGSPHSDHIHVTTGGDQQWGVAPQLQPAVYNSKASWGIAAATVTSKNTVAGYTRPVPNFIGVSQNYGQNPTKDLPADHWLIRTFGNYQPNGHTGTDYNAAAGTDVYAVGPGTVLWAGKATDLPGDDSHAGYVARWYIAKGFAGNVLVIDHGPFLGIYAHLSAFLVARGARVVQGQRVALSGNTGASTGPHLHFEVVPTSFQWGNGMYGRVNPANYLTLKNVTLAPGYTGGTTRNAPLSLLEQIMALDRNSDDYKTLVRDIAKGVMDYAFSDVDGKFIHLGEVLSWHRRDQAKTRRTEKNTEAIAAAVNPATIQAAVAKAIGDTGPEVNVQQLSAQIVADLIKETQA